jgi:hypothetical protein
LVDAISVADLATGFVNRLVLFDSGDTAPQANLEREDVFPSAMQRVALELKRHEPRGTTTLVKFDTPTYSLFRDFDVYAREIAARGEEHEIWGRANQNALILAGIVAVGINPKRPKITQGVAEWATRLVRWSIQCWLTRIGETAARSRRESQSKKVESLIRRSRSLAHRAGKKDKYKELMKVGRMPRAVLLRLCRDLTSRDLEDIVNQLLEADLIGTTQDDTGLESYWPKT